MAIQFSFEKVSSGPTRKFRLLPRLGLVIDFAGRRLAIKAAPIGETLANLFDRGFSFRNLMAVAMDQLNEIELPRVMGRSRGSAGAPGSRAGAGAEAAGAPRFVTPKAPSNGAGKGKPRVASAAPKSGSTKTWAKANAGAKAKAKKKSSPSTRGAGARASRSR